MKTIITRNILILLLCVGANNAKGKNMFFKEHKKIWLSGLNFKNHTIPFWYTIAITAMLIQNDENIYSEIKVFQKNNPRIDRPSEMITLLGDGYVDFSVLGLFYLKGLLGDDQRAKNTADLGFRAIMHTGIIVQVLKHATGRQRPSAENGKDGWHGPSGAFKRYSPGRWAYYDAFPSGHTIAAWSLATVIAHQYSHIKIIPPLCYSLAIGAGISRVTEDTHWVSDVFLGTVIGFEVTKQILVDKSPMSLTFKPYRNGIQMIYTF